VESFVWILLCLDAHANIQSTRVTPSWLCSDEHEKLKTFVVLIQEELQKSNLRNEELSSSVDMLQEKLMLQAAQATISTFDESLLTCRQVSASSATRPETEITAHDEMEQVCDELLLRMHHQVLRPRTASAALSAVSQAVASAIEGDFAGEDGGRCESNSMEKSYKLSLEEARREIEVRQREIEALDATVGQLIVEIMDMLVNASSFHKGQMEVQLHARAHACWPNATCCMSDRLNCLDDRNQVRNDFASSLQRLLTSFLQSLEDKPGGSQSTSQAGLNQEGEAAERKESRLQFLIAPDGAIVLSCRWRPPALSLNCQPVEVHGSSGTLACQKLSLAFGDPEMLLTAPSVVVRCRCTRDRTFFSS